VVAQAPWALAVLVASAPALTNGAAVVPIPSALSADLATAIGRGLDYLGRAQLADGAIPLCWVATAPECSVEDTTWTGAMVSVALARLEDPRARKIRDRVRTHLESQREPGDLWRWWARDDKRHAAVPTDLDDTACALFALGGGSKAHLSSLQAYRTKEGRFVTWTAPAAMEALSREAIEKRLAAGFGQRTDSGNDVDSGVNLNVLRYAASVGADLPDLCRWLSDQLATGAVARSSLYYLEPAHLYYLAAHAASAGASCLEEGLRAASPDIVRSLSRRAGNVSSPTATSVFTLLHLGVAGPSIDAAVRALLAAQGPDGSWPATPSISGGHGSRALDTALVIEALDRYQRRARAEGSRPREDR